MTKNIFGIALCTMLLALSVSAQAQQATKIPRIGYLGATSPAATAARIDGFKQGCLTRSSTYAGSNFASVTSGVTSSNTALTGIPTLTSCHGQSMTLLTISTRPPVPSMAICATT